ncbi:HAD family hydrolase [Rhodovarius crocodyli]|uniref:phosphoglycolate phosphatase n=1 Tax=Rhodovarius crocodyli TaxID=1979269 RepID=A0A437MMT5_9PROT|nr:HAD-IA family hydrolase [Rhodovarius crocodyli]RVT98968.1 HAD family hydrolase [Rhodovarius crocodyli]
MTRLAVFDLDGTLVDTAPDLAAALNRQMTARGLAEIPLPKVTRMIGDGARVLLERGFAFHDRPFEEAALEAFLEDPDLEGGALTTVFAGIPELLAHLQAEGWRMAVCTNKPEKAARGLLANLGVDHYFRAIGGGDSFPTRKPDPAHLLHTMGAAGGGRAVMIGDHMNDMLAARGAGIPAIFVTYGYGPVEMAGGNPTAASTEAVTEMLAAF